MSDIWQEWWQEKHKVLADSSELQITCEQRQIDPKLVLSDKCGLATPTDWPMLQAGWSGLEKWVQRMPMPAMIWEIDGEFGQEGLLMRSCHESCYVSPRVKGTTQYRPYAMGWTKAMESIWQNGWCIAVEGIWDRLAVLQYTPNVIAVLTDNVSSKLAEMLSRYVPVVGSMLDNDEFGRQGTLNSIQRLQKYKSFALDINYLQKYKDPSQAHKEDPHTMAEIMQRAIKELSFQASMARV